MVGKKVILSEGPDDQNAIYHLLKAHHLAEVVEINKTIQGIDQLLTLVPTALKPGGLDTYAIIVDADADVDEELQWKHRWQSMRKLLTDCGYTLPDSLDPKGLILEHDDLPRVGVWLMPDNTTRGMLEDFAKLLIPENDVLWPVALEATSKLPIQLFKSSFEMKANIHTWLAWQKEPGKPIGQAITKRFLNPRAPQAILFVAWIQQLFDLKTRPK